MFISLSCPHPFDSLISERLELVVQKDEDFNCHTQYFKCTACGKELEKSYSSFIGGVAGFMERGRHQSKG